MIQTREEIGCEEYLYRDIGCCLHPCSASLCPEPICAVDFPGGIGAYRKFKKLQVFLRSGMSLDEAAVALGMRKFSAQTLFNKGKKVFSASTFNSYNP